MTRKSRPIGVIVERLTAAEIRSAWVSAARELSPAARAIAATAPVEEIGPKILALAYAGRLHETNEDEDLLDRIERRARRIDPAAFEVYDRAGRATSKELQDRRSHAWRLASDEWICGDDPAIAAALAALDGRTRQ